MMRRLLIPSIPVGFWMFVVAGLCLSPRSAQLVSGDGDPLTHALMGAALLEQGAQLQTDPILAPPTSVQLHEWGFEVLLALFGQALGGLPGYALLGAMLVATAGALCLAEMLRQRAGWGFWFVAAIGLPFLFIHQLARPHLASWVLVVVMTAIFERWRGGLSDRGLWISMAVMGVVWVNLHGGFVYGGVIGLAFGLDALWRAARREADARVSTLLGGGALFVLGTLLNPEGPRIYGVVLGFLLDPEALSPITDMVGLNPLDPGQALPVLWIGAGFAVLVAQRRHAPLFEWLLMVMWSLLTIRMVRNAPLMMLGTAPILCRRLEGVMSRSAELRDSSNRMQTWLNHGDGRLGAGVLLAAVIGVFSAGWVEVSLWRQTQPVAALQWLADHPEMRAGPGFTMFSWGGVIAHQIPGTRVFIHPLNATYPRERQRAYLQVHFAEAGWPAVLQEAGLRWALVQNGAPIAAAMQEDERWSIVYEDETASVFAETLRDRAAEER